MYAKIPFSLVWRRHHRATWLLPCPNNLAESKVGDWTRQQLAMSLSGRDFTLETHERIQKCKTQLKDAVHLRFCSKRRNERLIFQISYSAPSPIV